MTLLLEPMIGRLHAQKDLRATLDQAVHDVVALHGAEFGDIQLRTPDGSLVLVGHVGLSRSFLEGFLRLGPEDQTICARALHAGGVVVVDDVTGDPQFAAYMERTRSSPFRAVLSAPLVTSGGMAVGVISAHFAHAYRPTAVEVASLEAYCLGLADRIETLLGSDDVEVTAETLARDMLARTR